MTNHFRITLSCALLLTVVFVMFKAFHLRHIEVVFILLTCAYVAVLVSLFVKLTNPKPNK